MKRFPRTIVEAFGTCSESASGISGPYTHKMRGLRVIKMIIFVIFVLFFAYYMGLLIERVSENYEQKLARLQAMEDKRQHDAVLKQLDLACQKEHGESKAVYGVGCVPRRK